MSRGEYLWQLRPTLSDAGAIACFLALSAVFAVATLRPAMARAEREREERETLATKTVALREADDALASAVKQRSSLRDQRGSMVTLGTISDLNARLAEIPVVAETHGVAVSEVVPGTPQQRGRLTRVPLRVAGVASFRSFSAMLAELHANHRDLEVTAFSIDAEGSGRDSGARFSLAMVWHTTSAPAAAQTAPEASEGSAARTGRADGADPEARSGQNSPR
jgi:Tfp pilus assembly protein PilO